MKLRPGLHVMDQRGRTMRLATRVKIAGRKGWEAQELPSGRTLYVLDTEIVASKVAEGYQLILA